MSDCLSLLVSARGRLTFSTGFNTNLPVILRGKTVVPVSDKPSGPVIFLIYSRLAGKLKRMPGGVVIREPSPSGTNCPAGVNLGAALGSDPSPGYGDASAKERHAVDTSSRSGS